MARGRRTPPVWPWILTAATLGGGIYLMLPGQDVVAGPEGGTEAAPFETRAVQGSEDAEVDLRPIVPTDTAVAPGSSVHVSVRAVSATGRPLSNVPVRFAVDRGSNDALLTEDVWTDGDGIAGTVVIMPARPVEVIVHAGLVGAAGPATRFTILGRGAIPQQMEYLGGDGQEADPGGMLPLPYVIEVVDADGRPRAGLEVRFQVVSGGGRAEPSTARTDSLGRASTRWTLGPAPGFQTMAAMSDSVEAPVTFTAIATQPPTPAPPAAAPTARPPLPEADRGRIAPPERRNEARSVTVVERTLAVGGSSVCAIRGGRVTCRGSDDRGQAIAGGLDGARAVAAGLVHACALDVSGIARCWGANDAGQLGDGTRTDRDAPTLVATDLRFSALSSGVSHTCGLTGEGRAACWGQNLAGQLGDGSRDGRTTPGQGEGPSFVSIDAGWHHTCGVTAAGIAHCWGLNREGQVGDGSTLDRLVPQQIVSSVLALAAGGSHTCAIAAGGVLCWGDNRWGQLGDGSTEPRVRPVPVVDLPGAPTQLVAGAAHTCALVTGGTVYCWGLNLHGQLGDGTTTNATRPMRVSGAMIFQGLWAGGAVTCGVAVDGQEYCWGLNQSGQLGDGTLTNRSVPTAVLRG